MKMNSERWWALFLASMIMLLFFIEGWYTAVVYFVGIYSGMVYMEILTRRTSKLKRNGGEK